VDIYDIQVKDDVAVILLLGVSFMENAIMTECQWWSINTVAEGDFMETDTFKNRF
jgi:hypothetical protein